MSTPSVEKFPCRVLPRHVMSVSTSAPVRPPGGRTGALVETLITWRGNAREGNFSTLGVDTDQLAAAVIATEKMLNAVAAPRGRARA